ncbi:xanthine dehydrogenase accessory protein XdhC (plasmid) [Paroceanicella profunda]|uniref:Xanthine dehydrogenase accessory protein XdhC n=1 Tax=Paroceanicella profunda TaxID=2579971 RepID=A0A5B8G485_9RHOB|nr:xanthine dehydrogenase accessory protein XdhC [Paroceanicella profunda]QDL94132.1 xanthine dehydrogenase accessory protein XdhC [Paroceanicella profunda]
MTAGIDIDALGAAVARAGCVVRVVVAGTGGSAPREAGAAMLVWRDGQSGTIGGGALELEATARARALLEAPGPWARAGMALALGPALGQCCGGSVSLLLERFTAREADTLAALVRGGASTLARPTASGEAPLAGVAPPHAPLGLRRLLRAARAGASQGGALVSGGWAVEPVAGRGRPVILYGAGHVGRALVHALQGLPYRVLWVDTAAERFPAAVPEHAERLVAVNPADAVPLAPPEARHIVMTYSHALDLEICHRVLARPFARLGLIGSASKAARFRSRLKALGHSEAAIARLDCPIGERALGKAPAAVALGIAVELLREDAAAAAAQPREGVA